MNKIIFISLVFILAYTNAFSQMAGTYTIGGSSPDYSTFNEAVSDLISNGVSSAVTFNVQSGTYDEQLIIPAITGASATNIITFQSESGDSSDVLITHAIINGDSLYIVKFDTTSYITFKSVSFNSINSTHSRPRL